MEVVFFQFIIFILGLCVGSFVNMAVYRYAIKNKLTSSRRARPLEGGRRPWRSQRDCFATLPPVVGRGAMTKKRSFCDGCGRQLRWFENVPVISWLIQGRKSRCCQTPLPYSYPLVELGTGILFLINFQTSIFDLHIFLALVMIGLIVFATVVDLKYMILPDGATVAMIILALIMGVSVDKLLAGVGGVAFLGGLHLITKGKGMGLGDVKLALFMGLLLGIKGLVVAFYVAFIVGAIVGVVMLALNKKKLKSPIPFGPFLLLGTLTAKFLIR